MQFVCVYEDILVYADNPHSRTSDQPKWPVAKLVFLSFQYQELFLSIDLDYSDIKFYF